MCVCGFIGCGVKTFSMPRTSFCLCPASFLPARRLRFYYNTHTDLRVASPAHVTFRHDLAHVYPAFCRTSPISPQRLAASPNLLLCLHIICPKNRRNATRHAQFIISPSKFEQFQVAKSDGAAATSPASQPARSLPLPCVCFCPFACHSRWLCRCRCRRLSAASASASAAFDS